MVHNRQLAAWVCASAALCLAHSAGRLSWFVAAAVIAGMSGILLYIMYALPAGGIAEACFCALGQRGGRILLLLCVAWTALMAGFAAALTAEAFPMVQAYPAVPLTVLLLSGWAGQKGRAVGARVSALVLPFLAAFFALIVCFGWSEVKPQPWRQVEFDLRAVCVLLLPLGAAQLSRGEGRLHPWRWIAALCAAATALSLVALPWDGLYRAVMSISVFGVMERFEALLCASMAVSGVCLCMLLSNAGLGLVCHAIWNRKETAQTLFWVLCLTGLALTDRQNTHLLLLGDLIFWVLIPVITQWVAKTKKVEKR